MNTIHDILIVGTGGFIGSTSRYVIGGWVQSFFTNALFPSGTFAVNAIGCLLIGLFVGLSENALLSSPSTRLFFSVGVLGGFTTFSTFGYETFALIREHQAVAALVNVTGNLVVGILAVWLGYLLAMIKDRI